MFIFNLVLGSTALKDSTPLWNLLGTSYILHSTMSCSNEVKTNDEDEIRCISQRHVDDGYCPYRDYVNVPGMQDLDRFMCTWNLNTDSIIDLLDFLKDVENPFTGKHNLIPAQLETPMDVTGEPALHFEETHSTHDKTRKGKKKVSILLSIVYC